MAKRTFDIVMSALLLLMFSPLLALVCAMVRLSMGGPVLFRQKRPGLGGKPFTLLKVRTMADGRDRTGMLLPDGQRLTRLGAVLRRYSLDELPQLLNVLRGDMSLVGPRPLLMEYLPLYTEEQRRRHEVRPGITGWAQINGRNAQTWEERFELDLWYVENRSFWLDLRILAATARHLILPRDTSSPGHATMPRFKGTEEDDKQA